MRLMVCGSRSWKYRSLVRGWLIHFHPTVVIHGGAEGADSVAEEVARELGILTDVRRPDLSRPSPQRYHERNDRMLDECDFVLAFWDGKSPGTKSVIDKAKRRKIPHKVVVP